MGLGFVLGLGAGAVVAAGVPAGFVGAAEAVDEAAVTGRGVGVADARPGVAGEDAGDTERDAIGSGAVRASPGLLDPPQAALSSSADRAGAHGNERMCAGCPVDHVSDRGRWS